MPRVNQSGITKEQFEEATTNHALVDKYGRHWRILLKLPDESQPALMVRCPGHDSERLRYDQELGIIDDEWATLLEFNEPSARIVLAG